MRFFFKKNEKLTSENEIERLFKSGKSSFIYPIKLLFVSNTCQPIECKVLVTASKRYLKNAVDRNIVKRRLREAYRLNSINIKKLLVEKNLSASVAFVYTSSKIIAYEKIEAIMIKHLMNIENIIEKSEKDS